MTVGEVGGMVEDVGIGGVRKDAGSLRSWGSYDYSYNTIDYYKYIILR